jgi:hypothetical protein
LPTLTGGKWWWYTWTGLNLIRESLGRSSLERKQQKQLESNPLRTEPRWRKVRPITDITSTALTKEEMAVHL